MKTSNPGSADVQDRALAGGGNVHDHVASLVRDVGAEGPGEGEWDSVGAVVGATYPAELARLREAMPRTPLLVPGYGAQGGGAEDCRTAFGPGGLGAIVNSSRGITFAHLRGPLSDAYDEARWRDATRAATVAMRDALRAVGGGRAPLLSGAGFAGSTADDAGAGGDGAIGSGPPWYERAFAARYLRLYAHRSDEAAGAEARFVARRLGLRRGARVLDAGCGSGRHSAALARTGAIVVGLDLSTELLAVARERPEGFPVVRADLRRPPFRAGAFDAVVSLFTTFGYFDDDGNRAQLEAFRRVSRRGGGLVLDFLNAEHVAQTLVPRSERRLDGARVVEERRIRAGRVEKDVVWHDSGARPPHRWRESVRLYDRDELVAQVRSAGFAVREVLGGLGGRPWSEAAPRTVVIGSAA